jgi:hypothetical protein
MTTLDQRQVVFVSRLALVLLVPLLTYSHQAPAQQSGDVFSHSTPSTPPDQFSGGCNNANNPYVGMDPLVCKGISQPVDNHNQCSLPRAQFLRRLGNMCYYCQSIPRMVGIIVPISQIGTTYRYYRCGADQADNCSAICSGGPPASAGNPNSMLPPACQGANPPEWCPNHIGISAPNCKKGVTGGYDPSANPACEKVMQPLPWEQPAYAAPPQGGARQDSPQCLYRSEAYRSGQVIRLNADVLAQDMSPADYNCFAYAQAFITGAFPGGGKSDFTSFSAAWLRQQGFSRRGLSKTLNSFPPAKLGDLVLVETATDQTGAPWDHVGIVIGVDRNNRITRIRQKLGPNAEDCVIDTTAAQFQAIDSLNPGEQYELWRNDSIDFLGNKLAR